jgi:chemotaxis protein methyltransferase CheR
VKHGGTGKLQSVEVEEFLENIAYQKLKRLLHETVGLNCDGYREEYLKRRLAVRLSATGANTYRRYVRYLKKNPAEYNLVLNNMVINYTTFFRDRDVYVYLEKMLLPKLLKSNKVKIWSAGCATGEEPYSLAILAHNLLGEKLPSGQVKIFASDIDEEALAYAVKGEYTRKQLIGLEDSLIDKYFLRKCASYRVKDFVRQLVRFEKQDLMNPSLRKEFDLILCRNVMIFFSRESQQQIHMHFYKALREEGYLVIGKSEVLSGEPSKSFICADVNCRVYQKPAAARSLCVAKTGTPLRNELTGGQLVVRH